MRNSRLWAGLLGVQKTVIERVEFDPDQGVVIASVRPVRGQRQRCGVCQRRCGGYDQGAGSRRWRALDLGTVPVLLQASVPRVRCPVHGVVVAAVPWARHGAGHTRHFDAQVAWLAVACSKSTVTQLMRIAWRTVGSIVTRVCAEMDQRVDRLAGLRRIGIDEISYKKGHRYLTIVVDHDTGRLVWAAPGRDRATLSGFFQALGEGRCQALTHVSGDGADWIGHVVAQYAPQAVLCADPFHVVSWASQCLDDVRREVWNLARRQAGNSVPAGSRVGLRYTLSQGTARGIQRSRWALWKNPEDLTEHQRAKLAWIAATSPRLYRAYLLKEGLRFVFTVKGEQGRQALDRWLAWVQRCRIPVFVELGRKVKRHLPAIHATLEHRLSNGLVESVNTKIRLLTRIAYGFTNPHALIALALLALGGYRPALPGR